jgi:hypothetical protein
VSLNFSVSLQICFIPDFHYFISPISLQENIVHVGMIDVMYPFDAVYDEGCKGHLEKVFNHPLSKPCKVKPRKTALSEAKRLSKNASGRNYYAKMISQEQLEKSQDQVHGSYIIQGTG